MNLTIEMPFEAYRGLVNQFDPTSVQFSLLAGGYVERRPGKGRFGVVVQVSCETKEARLLLNTATQIYVLKPPRQSPKPFS
jgi:hypothetical protein